MLSEKQEKEYMESGAARCPHCGSENISQERIEPSGTTSAYANVSCKDCEASWVEIYKLIGIEN